MLQSPDYVADASLLGPWDSVCLPQGCEPCRNAGITTPEVQPQTGKPQIWVTRRPSCTCGCPKQPAAMSVQSPACICPS